MKTVCQPDNNRTRKLKIDKTTDHLPIFLPFSPTRTNYDLHHRYTFQYKYQLPSRPKKSECLKSQHNPFLPLNSLIIMGIKLYGSAMSTAVQRALVCLYEKEIEFEFVTVDMRSGEHKKEHYLAKNV